MQQQLQFKVGDNVYILRKTKNKPDVKQPGEVVEVVPPDMYSKTLGAFHKGHQLGKRPLESYIVRVGNGKSGLLWPYVTQLSPSKDAPEAHQCRYTTKPYCDVCGLPGKTATVVVGECNKKTTVTEQKMPDGTVKKVTITEETLAPEISKIENDFIICLDTSGSMASCSSGAIKAFNDEVEAIKIAANQIGMKMPKVTLWFFGESATPVRCVFSRQPADQLQHLNDQTYKPQGGTPMFDCIADAIEAMRKQPDANNENLSIVLHVITDGQENQSSRYAARFNGAEKLASLMSEVKSTNRWTFAFMLPKGDKLNFLKTFPQLDIGNVIEWETTNQGAAQASRHTQSAVSSYMSARSMGATSMKNFYLQPDLSKIKPEDLAKLTNLSNIFKMYEVKREINIKEFIKGATGGKYVIGSAYYQLEKKEKIQAQKNILLRDRFNGDIYGGNEARKLIGLPFGQTAVVEPGNHAQFDIFVESTSVNRILSRGLKVLHDSHQVIDKQPTWDHTQMPSA